VNQTDKAGIRGLGALLALAMLLGAGAPAFGEQAGALGASASPAASGGSTAPAALAPSAASAPSAPAAPTEASVKNGDNAWVLMGTALVFLMTAPGLALFYGGLVRKKNVLSVLMQCMVLMCLISVQWVLVGYSLAFGPDHGGLIGGLDWAGLRGVSAAVPHWDAAAGLSYAPTIPHQTFMIFQMMFAVITPGLIIGAFAERMRFGPFCLFTLLWATLVYDPVAHWVWGVGGVLGLLNATGKGAYDFAGGTVVHVNAGIAALACALFLGKRRGYPDKMSPPHNLPFAVIGAGLLWFGWFGFNAASALGADKLATSAFVVTHLGAATAGLAWAFMDWICNKRPTLLGVITGAVGGLVAITPASGFVNVLGAMCIGVGVSVICWTFVSVVKVKLGYDDALDAFGVHGVGGIWGAIATGLFATGGAAINSVMTDGGLFYGPNGAEQLLRQLKAVGITIVYSFVGTFVLLKLVNLVLPLRASESEETIGLDLTQHRETAYTLIH
jgi:ammonium transporter, Amt family